MIAVTPRIIAAMVETDPNTITLDGRMMRQYIKKQEYRLAI